MCRPLLVSLRLSLILGLLSQAAWPLCVTAERAKLRKGPGQQHPVSWVAMKFTPLIEEQRKGKWIKVLDMDREAHWVASGDVTSRFRCVSVRRPAVGIYTRPDRTSPTVGIGRVGRYMSLKRLDDEPLDLEGWLHVQDPWGDKFWIREDHVWKPNRISTMEF